MAPRQIDGGKAHPSRKNTSLILSILFDKCCIFVKNSVYLESLIRIRMSYTSQTMFLV